MGKNPRFNFYPSDWTRDLQEHPLEIEGAWIRIICKLWWEYPKGKATKLLEEWAKILGVNKDETERILLYIKKKKIGDVSVSVTLGHKNITVMSRRMYREWKAKEFHRLRQQKYRARRKGDGKVTVPSSYLLNSSYRNSHKSVTKSPMIEVDGKPIPLKEFLEKEE